MKRHILLIVLLALAIPVRGQYKIYLRSVKGHHGPFSYEIIHPTDTTFIHIYAGGDAEGIRFPDYFELNQNIPDTSYQVFVDGVLRQEGCMKSGSYSGTLWKKVDDDFLKTTTYRNGRMQGADETTDRKGQLIYFRWYDNGICPIITSWYPNGKIKEHNFYLNEGLSWGVFFSESGELSGIRQSCKPPSFFNNDSFIPFKNGLLDGQAEWKQKDQVVHVTFAQNEITDWEIYTGVAGARHLAAEYHKTKK